jgi:serine protease Do
MIALTVMLAIAGGLEAFEPPQKTGGAGGSYLGIAVAEVDEERAKALNLKEETGVEITRLEDEGPAAAAGLKVGDVVLEYNDERIDSVEELIRLVRETPPGREITLGVSRAGSLQRIALKTASRKSIIGKQGPGAIEIPRIEIPSIRIPDMPRAYMSWRSTIVGIEAESIDSQLAQYFGVKEGVLVRSVAKNSAADRAGLKAGDVITRVDGNQVTSLREVSDAIRSSPKEKPVSLVIVRERREMTLSLSLNENER